MDFQRAQSDRRERRELLMLEIEAQAQRVVVDRLLHVGDQIADTVKRDIAPRDCGRCRLPGRRIRHDALALW
jgi:hypothetical protein